MTPELLASLAGILLSLLTAYLPGFSTWYASLPGDRKRLIMLAALLLTALASFGLTCAGFGSFLGLAQTCDAPSAVKLLTAFIAALIANQSTFVLAVRPRTAKLKSLKT